MNLCNNALLKGCLSISLNKSTNILNLNDLMGGVLRSR